VCASDRPRSAIISTRSQAQFEPKLPAHTQNDDIAVKVSAGEQLFQALQLVHVPTSQGSGHQHSRPTSPVCTRALKAAVGKQPVAMMVRLASPPASCVAP